MANVNYFLFYPGQCRVMYWQFVQILKVVTAEERGVLLSDVRHWSLESDIPHLARIRSQHLQNQFWKIFEICHYKSICVYSSLKKYKKSFEESFDDLLQMFAILLCEGILGPIWESMQENVRSFSSLYTSQVCKIWIRSTILTFPTQHSITARSRMLLGISSRFKYKRLDWRIV